MNAAAVRELAMRLVEEDVTGRRCTGHTKVTIRAALRDFLRWASRRGTPDLRLMQKRDLVAYHGFLARQDSKRTGKPLAATTVNYRFHVVGLLFSCIYRAGIIAENPAHGLELAIPEPAGWRRRPLTRDEVTRFLESIDTASAQGLKDRTLFELIYSSGLRVAEAAALKVGDLDFDRRLMVVRGKFDRDRMVPFSEVARDFLVHYLGDRIGQADEWVFRGSRGATAGRHLASTSVSERFRELLRRFGMDRPEISTHSLRHSTATHLLENGASIRHVQELLGHRSIESTVRYTHVMTDGLARVYRRHHPREHELFEAVDDDYERRLSTLVARRPKEG